MLTIITHPHQTLRIKSSRVPMEDIHKLRSFFRDLEKTMQKRDGLGLAANQVNVTKRIISVNTKDGPLTLINPRLSRKSLKKEEAEEGCLSIPFTFGTVKRHYRLTVTAYDKNAKQIRLKAKGLLARVLQHEVDHLDGILFIDRAKKITKYDTASKITT